jgi:hypothetical protein
MPGGGKGGIPPPGGPLMPGGGKGGPPGPGKGGRAARIRDSLDQYHVTGQRIVNARPPKPIMGAPYPGGGPKPGPLNPGPDGARC